MHLWLMRQQSVRMEYNLEPSRGFSYCRFFSPPPLRLISSSICCVLQLLHHFSPLRSSCVPLLIAHSPQRTSGSPAAGNSPIDLICDSFLPARCHNSADNILSGLIPGCCCYVRLLPTAIYVAYLQQTLEDHA